MINKKYNKGEWSEPYVAIRILGDKKLYAADDSGNRNPNQWMEVIELIRHETNARIVRYKCSDSDVNIKIEVNGAHIISVPSTEFFEIADKLKDEIISSSGSSFSLSETITTFFKKIELLTVKAASINKSDVFLSLRDSRASLVRNEIGFSIKSEFGQNPTLFNTAQASALIYKVSGMSDELMEEINSIVDDEGKVSTLRRCDAMRRSGCAFEFMGFPIAARAKVRAFKENLELINPRLTTCLDYLLRTHFFEHERELQLNVLTEKMTVANPCEMENPENKYEYMIKAFLYAAYCGMTASTLWNGESHVNGGFIKVNANGDVVVYHALESDLFKTYLFNHCYLEFPSTSPKHGNYGRVYKENDEYFFRLNFQVRYKV